MRWLSSLLPTLGSLHRPRACVSLIFFLTVTTEGEGVVALPDVTTARTVLLMATALSTEAAVLEASRREATDFAVLHDVLADPVDARVAADRRVRRVDHDDLKELESSVLRDLVRVEHAEVLAVAPSTLLGKAAKGARTHHPKNPLVTGLAPDDAAVSGTPTTSAADTDAVDHVPLFRLVSETACLVRTRRARGAVNAWELPQFPAPNATDVPHHIRLLLLPDLRQETIRAHCIVVWTSFFPPIDEKERKKKEVEKFVTSEILRHK